MKDTLKLIGVLTLTCVVAGSLLAVVNNVTKDRIAAVKAEQKAEAIRQVLPGLDISDTTVELVDNGIEWTFLLAQAGDPPLNAAAAVEPPPVKGYGGGIRIMVGIAADGTITGLRILDHKETPGLGANIQGEAFRSQFVGMNGNSSDLRVKKDGGDVDAITAATISSRAVTKAVAEAIRVFMAHRDDIIGAR